MISAELESARRNMCNAERDADELAKHADEQYVSFLKDMSEAWERRI